MRWIYFFVGCCATCALVYLLVERDEAGLGDAVYHTTGAAVTGFGIFAVLTWAHKRKERRESNQLHTPRQQ